MCGITGQVNRDPYNPASRATLQRMCDSIVHRGPDDEGLYCRRNVALGMRRLKVIDLTTGNQPMYNEDRTVVTVFNGEIYNYRELRNTLSNLGHHFRTLSDTETIVHAYEEYGETFLTHLNGMFAIALWDGPNQKLLLARDRMGEKPLYYTETEEGIVFGSELKTIACNPNFRKELDLAAMYHYFTLICVPAPQTIYKNVHKLPPAHYLTYQNGKLQVKQYWELVHAPDFKKSEEDFAAGLRELMTASLKTRMISDVPLGAFLSGGIDSSVVVGLMSGIHSQPVKTFSIGFKEEKYNETAYARIVAKKFQTEHHELIVEPAIQDLLPKIVRHFDEPFGGPSAVPTYLVSQMARQHVTVALSGDGGDEAFLGYDSYANVLARRGRSRIPTFIRRLGQRIGRGLKEGASGKRYLESFGVEDPRYFCVGLTESWKHQLFSKDLLRAIPTADTFSVFRPHMLDDSAEFLTRYSHLDTKVYLPENVLAKVDRMSMANSLETRAPFLDHEIFEFAATIPADMKMKSGIRKHILKRSVADIMPVEILQRRKAGFALPTDVWLRGALKPALQNAVEWAARHAMFNRDYVNQLSHDHETGRKNNQRVLWSLLMFQLWHEQNVTA
jgi:asparagine synthase (glutamine-hydrolysing)